MRLHPPLYAEPPRPHLKAAAHAHVAGATADVVPVPPDPAKTQGFVMRGYNFAFTRYFALSVTDAAKARAFIESLVSGKQAWPSVTIASQWAPPKPNRCLNIGFTCPGLVALGVPQAAVDQSFGPTSDHNSFYVGAAAQAKIVGDVGQSDPANWRLNDRDFDVMLILWGATTDIIEEDTAMLKALLDGFAALSPDRIFDSQVLDNHKVWFGYRDGIAQPIVAGVPYIQDPDGEQELADPSAFMLGTALPGNAYAGTSVPVAPLGLNGCFGAFRILEQDVEGYEAQAKRLADADFCKLYGITDPDHAVEAVKALLCGRWTNGVSLSVFPIQGNTPPPTMLDNELNNFLYVLPAGEPAPHQNPDPTVNPDMGSHCPIGAHTRRGNMRGFPFADTPSVYHRIIRRASAYQLPYPPVGTDPGERGLMGLFLSGCLRDQFEFVQRNWINNWIGPSGFSSVKDQSDPVMGEEPNGSETFDETIGIPKAKNKLKGMSSFVATRAGAYCFFPGVDGIAWIGGLKG
ncbi:MAG: hypothetical protein ABIS51_19535 [Sphingomonas sp.]